LAVNLFISTSQVPVPAGITIVTMFRLFLTLAFLAFVANQVHAQNCHLRELDLCAASLLVFTQGPSGLANTDAEMDRQCTFIKEADECIRNYTSTCATDLQQQLADMVFDGTAKLQKDYCTKGSQLRELYMKHSPCLRNAMREAQKPCIKDLQVAFEAMTEAKWDKRVGFGCCAYNRVGDCMSKALKKECGEETVSFVGNMTRAALSRLPDIMCAEHTLESPTCKELPPPGSAPKGGKTTSILNRLLSAYTNF